MRPQELLLDGLQGGDRFLLRLRRPGQDAIENGFELVFRHTGIIAHRRNGDSQSDARLTAFRRRQIVLGSSASGCHSRSRRRSSAISLTTTQPTAAISTMPAKTPAELAKR